MDRRYMVMQYLGQLRSMTPWRTPCQFQVFRCGDDKWLLMDPIDQCGCSLLRQFPVKRADLKPDVRRCFRANVAGGVYTTAARNEYDAKLAAHKTAILRQNASMAALGQALDQL